MGDGMSYTHITDKHINHKNFSNIINKNTLSTFFAKTKICNLDISLSI